MVAWHFRYIYEKIEVINLSETKPKCFVNKGGLSCYQNKAKGEKTWRNQN